MVEPIVKRCAGLDVHKMSVVATVLIEQGEGNLVEQTRAFGTFHHDRQALCDWLKEQRIELAVMESTGTYWKSIYAALEAAGLPSYVVNARHVKRVPGRKTDVGDSQWLASLARFGLLRPSFIPPVDLRELRLITRHRMKLKGQLASEKNRLQKVLDDAGIRLGGVVSDIHGVSAQAMIDGLIAGQPVAKLVTYAKGRLQAKQTLLAAALDEPLSEHHRLLLQELHRHIGFLEQQLQTLDEQIFAAMVPYQRSWQLLQTIPGIDELSAALLIAELGVEMSRFGSAEQLAAWAGMCPGQNESAGKRKPVRARKGNRVLRQILCEVANAACKTKSQFKGKYQALVIRRGHKRSIIALGHKILRVMYAVLSSQQPYRDPGIDYEALVVAKNAPRWLKALEKYGYVTKLRPVTA
jgi:transposase